MIYDHQPEDLEEDGEFPLGAFLFLLLALGAAAYFFTSHIIGESDKPLTSAHVTNNNKMGLKVALPSGWDCYLVADTLTCRPKAGHEQSKD